ncbi:MAG: hypothetical protein ACFCVB_10895 [Nodosilinea sp.]
MKLLDDDDVRLIFNNDFFISIVKSSYSYLDNYNDPFRCNAFGLMIRELVRLVFAELAPDSQVKRASWFIGDNGKVTRMERYRFGITGHIGDSVIANNPALNSIGTCKDLRKSIDDLNKYAHISPGTSNLHPNTSTELLETIENVILDYARTLSNSRKEVKEQVIQIVQENIFPEIIERFPEELDILSTRTIVREVIIEDVNELDIYNYEAEVILCGTVCVELNWGGSIDDASIDKSFPVEIAINLCSSDFSFELTEIEVDDSSWYEE